MTHPLLKNFGTGFNEVRINVAQNNMEISKYQLKATVMNLVVDVQQTYWDLVLAANDLATRRHSLEVAQHLQGRTAEMISKGRLPAITLFQAKTAVLEREIDLVAGENASEDAQARLRAFLNLDKVVAPGRIPTLVPADAPRIESNMVSIEGELGKALWRSAQSFFRRGLDQENRVLGERFAKNQQMPELNFIGSIGLSGLSGSPTPNPCPYNHSGGYAGIRSPAGWARAPAPTKEGAWRCPRELSLRGLPFLQSRVERADPPWQSTGEKRSGKI